jgi:hypothetical protein
VEAYTRIVNSLFLDDDSLSNFVRTPSYMIPCVGTVTESAEFNPMMVIKCVIKLSGNIQDFHIAGELIQCDCKYMHSCWSTKSGIKTGTIWKGDKIFLILLLLIS